MNDFSWLSSVIIPICVSLPSSSVAYFIGIRKEKNNVRNQRVDTLNKNLDELYKDASRIFKAEYDDTDYHFMVYAVDNLSTELAHYDSDMGKFNFSPLKIILTDKIFHEKNDRELMKKLSEQIQVIKKNLKKRFL